MPPCPHYGSNLTDKAQRHKWKRMSKVLHLPPFYRNRLQNNHVHLLRITNVLTYWSELWSWRLYQGFEGVTRQSLGIAVQNIIKGHSNLVTDLYLLRRNFAFSAAGWWNLSTIVCCMRRNWMSEGRCQRRMPIALLMRPRTETYLQWELITALG